MPRRTTMTSGRTRSLSVLSIAVPTTTMRPALAQDAGATSGALELQPGQLQGVIVGLDGKTPIAGAKVVLLDDAGSGKWSVVRKVREAPWAENHHGSRYSTPGILPKSP